MANPHVGFVMGAFVPGVQFRNPVPFEGPDDSNVVQNNSEHLRRVAPGNEFVENVILSRLVVLGHNNSMAADSIQVACGKGRVLNQRGFDFCASSRSTTSDVGKEEQDVHKLGNLVKPCAQRI